MNENPNIKLNHLFKQIFTETDSQITGMETKTIDRKLYGKLAIGPFTLQPVTAILLKF
ncbi:hypothetical protein WN55_07195 [Dufourea novaeangliae]|uniref:Uncharacterized protein n=1 Tax=Dufourea novaeangliae TaxID=178035 RepID=A0A154PRM3_DUFNO|nr:hypothetical protein WN55_07195 [Dufourea novaeangliae]